MTLFEVADLVLMLEGQTDVVEPVEQAMLAEGIDLEMQHLAVRRGHALCLEIDFEPVALIGLDGLEQPLDRGLIEGDQQDAVLEALLKKMSAKLGAMITRKPKSSSAQGACSRELPQPKLRRPSNTLAP